jgi:hypothetical protein
MDQEGKEVANSSFNLEKAILREGGDLTRSEKLARVALRIRTQVYGPCHNLIASSSVQVAQILLLRRKSYKSAL